MCYLVREHRAAAQSGDLPQPSSLDRLRPRWVGAVGAVLIGGLAVAAIVAPPTASPLRDAKPSAPGAPLAATGTAAPTPAGIERTSALPGDDEVARAAPGHCDHAL